MGGGGGGGWGCRLNKAMQEDMNPEALFFWARGFGGGGGGGFWGFRVLRFCVFRVLFFFCVVFRIFCGFSANFWFFLL